VINDTTLVKTSYLSVNKKQMTNANNATPSIMPAVIIITPRMSPEDSGCLAILSTDALAIWLIPNAPANADPKAPIPAAKKAIAVSVITPPTQSLWLMFNNNNAAATLTQISS
jgi:hypothetical protein